MIQVNKHNTYTLQSSLYIFYKIFTYIRLYLLSIILYLSYFKQISILQVSTDELLLDRTVQAFPILMPIASSAPARPPGKSFRVCSLLFLPVRRMQPEECVSSAKRALLSCSTVDIFYVRVYYLIIFRHIRLYKAYP